MLRLVIWLLNRISSKWLAIVIIEAKVILRGRRGV